MIGKNINLGILYPTAIEDLTKYFRNSEEIFRPYKASGFTLTSTFQDLVYTLEHSPKRAKTSGDSGPGASDLMMLVDLIEEIAQTPRGFKVPQNIMCQRLAFFYRPQVDGFEFNYGVMAHYGKNNSGGEFAEEFGVLVPSRGSNHNALLVSNNLQLREYRSKMQVIIDTVKFAREVLKEEGAAR